MWTPQTCTCHVLPVFLLCKGNSPKNLLLLAYIHALSSMRLCLVCILWSLPLSLRIQSWELLWPMALPGSGAAVPALAGSDMLWLSRSCVTKSRNGCHSCSVCQLWKSSAFVLLKQCTCLVLGLSWATLWDSTQCCGKAAAAPVCSKGLVKPTHAFLRIGISKQELLCQGLSAPQLTPWGKETLEWSRVCFPAPKQLGCLCDGNQVTTLCPLTSLPHLLGV